jgi:hypothetical protein
MNVIDREKQYLTTRWQEQRDYYSRKSSENKRAYQRVQLVIGIGAVLVPVLLSFDIRIPFGDTQIALTSPLAAIISGLVAAAAAVENVYKYGENWRNFRRALEGLKREHALFISRAGKYRNEVNAFPNFVESIESIIAEETGNFTMPQQGGGQRGGTQPAVGGLTDVNSDAPPTTPQG